MKKRTIALVSVTLVLAILAVAVITTFPSYLFEEKPTVSTTNPDVQNDNIKPSQGDDVGVLGDGDEGIQGVLPGEIEIENITEEKKEEETPIDTASYETLDSGNGVKFIAQRGAFSEGTKFSINKLGIFSKKYYRVRHYVKDFTKNLSVYEIGAKNNGKDVQPTADARVVIEIPKNYNIDNVDIYYMLENGSVQKLTTVIDKDARTASANFMQSGIYILIEKDTVTDDSSNDAPSSDSNSSSNATSSEILSDNTSTESDNSSSTPTDTSSSVSSDNGSSDNANSSEETDSNTSSDNSSTESDPNQDSMDGWTPWY